MRQALMEFEKEEKLQQQENHIVKRMLRNTHTVIPQDIIFDEILTRLPAKSLVRFRLVCKSWKHIFSTPDFVKAHFTRQQSYKDQDLLIGHKLKHGTRHIIIISRSSEIPITVGPWCSDILLGSINGLVCMASGNNFCLWNPAIGRIKDICFPSRCSKDCLHLLGFSWDPVGDDYKVVVACLVWHSTCSTRHLYIYSCKSARWTQLLIPINVVPNDSHSLGGLKTAPCTIVKGLPYWSSLAHYASTCLHAHIYVFKFVAENNDFRLLPQLRLEFLTLRYREFNLVNSNNYLRGMVYEKGCLNFLVDVYDLDEESDSGLWSKMYTIESITICDEKCWLSQCFKNGGEILIVIKNGPLFLYDPKTEETKFVKSTRYDLARCYSYTPSLVFVQGMESIVLFSSHEMQLKKLAIEYSNLVRRSGSSSDSPSSDSDSRTSSGNDSDAETDSDSINSSRSDSDADKAQS